MAYFIGLMSGTSMDAVDAVLVDFNTAPKLITHHSHPIPDAIRETLDQLLGKQQFDVQNYGMLDVELGRLFGEASLTLIQNSSVHKQQISAIGSHGQTVYHAPTCRTPFTLQLGDPNHIAQSCGVTTVADFRRRDMAAGGQGAPLVPAFHNAVFRSSEHTRIILNIGGIANITVLPKDPDLAVTGFDTGPGNCLMDEWIKENMHEAYDQDGRWAASGKVNQALLKRLLADNYFKLPPPKSSGREYFNLAWQYLKDYSGPAESLQATLAQVTIESIAQAIETQAPDADEIYVCGGGAHNPHLMNGLRQRLGPLHIETTAALGIPPDWVEAMAFAWLAKQTLKHLPGNLPEVTGAQEKVILGAIYPA